MRSRRSGHTAFVEIALQFEAGLTMAEVAGRVDALKTSIRADAGNVELAILTDVAAQ